MKILITGANGRTGKKIISALRAVPDAPVLRGLDSKHCDFTDESVEGDITNPAVAAGAVAGVDAVVHYGPRLDPRETVMGTTMIDAAEAAGVKRFIFISVIHAEIDDLLNHKAKLAIEGYLINSTLDWTILRPQHYMQNIDVEHAITSAAVEMPYPVGTLLTQVDMGDLADAVVKVVLEAGHHFATYDISGDEALSVVDICNELARVSGKPVCAKQISADEMVERERAKQQTMPSYTVDGLHRLYGYYGRHGIKGNSNVFSWLVGRQPTSFETYVRRALAQTEG